jgi:hypothetical protein
MKKLILSITAIAAILFSGYSQCTPDPQFSAAGIYPDSATGLSVAYVGYPYEQIITIVTPSDTVVDIPLLGVSSVTIDNIDLTNVSGLPANFVYECDPVNCSFPGGTVKCARLYSTSNPVLADVGIYPIVFETTTYVSGVPVIGSTTQDDVIDYYFIEIMDTNGVNVGIEKISSESLELKTIYPNPVVDNSRIQFISGKNQNVTFNVMNVLGKTLVNTSIMANRGVNELFVSASDFPNGIYLYSITAAGKTSTKRMIIRK